MVPPLIAQLSDLFAPYPNLRRARSRPVPMGRCKVSRWCEGCRNKGRQSTVELGSRPNFRTDHAGFPNPIPPRSNPGTNHRKRKFTLYFNMILIWRRECQSTPIERSSIFDLPRPKPTVRATAGKWDFAFDRNQSHPMTRRRQQCHQATSERQIAVAPLSLIGRHHERSIARFRKAT